jgi:hypothetical protein
MRRQSPETLIAALVDDLKPRRRLTLRDGLLLCLGAAVLTGLVGAVGIGLRADVLAAHLNPIFLLSSGLFLLLAAAASYTVIEMSRPYVGGHRDGWIWAAAMTSLLPAAALIVSAAAWWQHKRVLIDLSGAKCLATGVCLGLIMALALAVWLRRGAPTSLERAGLLTGLAAGSIGIFVFALHCPHNDIAHIGLWHGLAVGISALLGRFLVPVAIRW